ncbi:MAG: hypothetical protein GY926_21270 [bacterium]|nr:hypothetical protein [bacterium]
MDETDGSPEALRAARLVLLTMDQIEPEQAGPEFSRGDNGQIVIDIDLPAVDET